MYKYYSGTMAAGFASSSVAPLLQKLGFKSLSHHSLKILELPLVMTFKRLCEIRLNSCSFDSTYVFIYLPHTDVTLTDLHTGLEDSLGRSPMMTWGDHINRGDVADVCFQHLPVITSIRWLWVNLHRRGDGWDPTLSWVMCLGSDW